MKVRRRCLGGNAYDSPKQKRAVCALADDVGLVWEERKVGMQRAEESGTVSIATLELGQLRTCLRAPQIQEERCRSHPDAGVRRDEFVTSPPDKAR